MFTNEEFSILCSAEVTAAIRENIDRKPTDIALDRRIPHASVVATQVKNLQKCRTKLPSYFAVQAIVPTLAYEQSSSEECALRKRLEGESVLDLTCGLGVDAYALSKRFRRVVTIERNDGKCILCGLCVRTCEEVAKKGILGLIGRGFGTVVKPEFRDPQVLADCANCLKCAESCPTGAMKILK